MPSRNPWGRKGKPRIVTPGFIDGKPIPTRPMAAVISDSERELRESHQLVTLGRRLFGCSCGKVFIGCTPRNTSIYLGFHHDAVQEGIERAQMGESNLLEEGEVI